MSNSDEKEGFVNVVPMPPIPMAKTLATDQNVCARDDRNTDFQTDGSLKSRIRVHKGKASSQAPSG